MSITPKAVGSLWHVDPIAAYHQLWIQLHGVASLNANPVTWVYDLQRVASAA